MHPCPKECPSTSCWRHSTFFILFRIISNSHFAPLKFSSWNICLKWMADYVRFPVDFRKKIFQGDALHWHARTDLYTRRITEADMSMQCNAMQWLVGSSVILIDHLLRPYHRRMSRANDALVHIRLCPHSASEVVDSLCMVVGLLMHSPVLLACLWLAHQKCTNSMLWWTLWCQKSVLGQDASARLIKSSHLDDAFVICIDRQPGQFLDPFPLIYPRGWGWRQSLCPLMTIKFCNSQNSPSVQVADHLIWTHLQPKGHGYHPFAKDTE